jgi:hypothetical protein
MDEILFGGDGNEQPASMYRKMGERAMARFGTGKHLDFTRPRGGDPGGENFD